MQGGWRRCGRDELILSPGMGATSPAGTLKPMNEPFARILDPRLLEKTHEDAAAPAARQVGASTADVLETFRLFTAPIQLLATGQESFGRWLTEIRRSVPIERQREATPEIAGPVLMNLRFMSESTPLHRLNLNLLKAAIDVDHWKDAHPGFIKAIEHMSPADALLLQIIFETAPFQWALHRPDLQPRPLSWCLKHQVAKLNDWREEDIQAGLEVLSGLWLIRYEEQDVRESPEGLISYQSLTCWLTEYGEKFIRVCMPDGFPTPDDD